MLYVYRANALYWGARTAGIKIDGMRAAGLKSKGYISVPLTPGKHRIEQSWDGWNGGNEQLMRTVAIDVTITPNAPTYVRLLGIRTSTWVTYTPDILWGLHEVPAQEAKDELASTRRLELEKTFVP